MSSPRELRWLKNKSTDFSDSPMFLLRLVSAPLWVFEWERRRFTKVIRRQKHHGIAILHNLAMVVVKKLPPQSAMADIWQHLLRSFLAAFIVATLGCLHCSFQHLSYVGYEPMRDVFSSTSPGNMAQVVFIKLAHSSPQKSVFVGMSWAFCPISKMVSEPIHDSLGHPLSGYSSYSPVV